jgi:hypothetical protein
VDRDIGVDIEERGGGGAAKAVQASEDFIGYYREAGPGSRIRRAWGEGEEIGGRADDLDESVLEEGVTGWVLVSSS